MLSIFERIVRAGTDQFGQAVRARRWFVVTGAAPPAAALSGPMAADDPLTPPPVLMDHAVVGLLCNAYLAAFNELRYGSPEPCVGSAPAGAGA